jgi:hypothetical protein
MRRLRGLKRAAMARVEASTARVGPWGGLRTEDPVEQRDPAEVDQAKQSGQGVEKPFPTELRWERGRGAGSAWSYAAIMGAT